MDSRDKHPSNGSNGEPEKSNALSVIRRHRSSVICWSCEQPWRMARTTELLTWPQSERSSAVYSDRRKDTADEKEGKLEAGTKGEKMATRPSDLPNEGSSCQ